MKAVKVAVSFSGYQKLLIALLALAQFTIILDFMVMAPLGDMLMKKLHLSAGQFASAVSVYAFSAGISGLLAAGFADKYDRKKLLLFFYGGFILGTLICGVASTYQVLLAGRIITGLFGGVLGSVSMAIITDVFSFDQRGRVMGFVQMAFAVSQVLGIPVGLLLANKWGWGTPFYLIVVLSVLIASVVFFRMNPIRAHLEKKADARPFHHLQTTLSNRHYWLPFATTALLSIGGFLMMPFSAPFTINNLGIGQHLLPLVYVITGIGSFITLPLVGKASDSMGKLPIFMAGSVLSIIMVIVYTHLTPIPLWELVLINTILFAGIMSRMIPSQAMMTAIPGLQDRGAFMSINSSLQQIAGGVASVLAGFIIVQEKSGKLLHFEVLGYVAAFIMIVCVLFMIYINKAVKDKMSRDKSAQIKAGELNVI